MGTAASGVEPIVEWAAAEEGASVAGSITEIEVRAVALSGETIGAVAAAGHCTVGELLEKLIDTSAPVEAGMVRMFVFGDRMLHDVNGKETLNELFGIDSGSVLVQSLVSWAPVEFCPRLVVPLALSTCSATEFVCSPLHGLYGWSSVRAKEPLPRDRCAKWRIVVDNVANSGDVIVGVRHETMAHQDASTCLAYSFVVVGTPSGICGVNRSSIDFGPDTTTYMTGRRDYSPPISTALRWDDDAPGDGTEVVASWSDGRLAFAVNGVDYGTTFRQDHDEAALLPTDGYLYPFVCLRGHGFLRGSGTKVTLHPAPEA